MTFPMWLMYKHIKNRDAFEKLETPFIDNFANIAFKELEKDNPICKSIENILLQKHIEVILPEVFRQMTS